MKETKITRGASEEVTVRVVVTGANGFIVFYFFSVKKANKNDTNLNY